MGNKERKEIKAIKVKIKVTNTSDMEITLYKEIPHVISGENRKHGKKRKKDRG